MTYYDDDYSPYSGAPDVQDTPPSIVTQENPTTTAPTTGFKPDFSKTNPYEGMPIEYADLVKKTFVPTEQSPLNPVQVAALNNQLPAVIAESPTVQDLTTVQKDVLKTEANTITEAIKTQPSQYIPGTATATPKPDFTTPVKETTDIAARIKELEDQARLADEMRLQGTVNGVPLDDYGVIDILALQREAESARAKIAILKEWQDAGQALPPEVLALVSSQLSAYVQVNPDGTYTVDTLLAAKTGIDKELLKRIGVTDAEIEQAESIVNEQREAYRAAATVNKYPDALAAYQDGKIDALKTAGYDIDQLKALDALKDYKAEGGGYYLSDAANDGKTDLLLKAGFTKAQIDESVKAAVVITTVTTSPLVNESDEAELNRYKSEDGYDIVSYLRDNDNAEDVAKKLVAMGFDEADVKEAREYNDNPFVRETAQDKLNKAFVQAGGKLDGTNTAAELDKILKEHPELLTMQSSEEKVKGLKAPMSFSSFVDNFVAVREDLPEYQSLKNKKARTAFLKDMASREYMRLYGEGTTLASQGTDILVFVAPAARALHPEVTIQDIKATEWAITGANIVLLAVSPVLGKVGSTVLKTISKVGEVGASLVYPAVTALEWNNMSPGERVLNVALDATIASAILAKPIIKSVKNLNPGVGFNSRVESLSKAVKSGNTTSVWKAADRLEEYGRRLKEAGIQSGTRIQEYGTFIKDNAKTIAKAKGGGGATLNSYDVLVNELKQINEAMAKVRQKGAFQIGKDGKIYDEYGREMTPERQMERIREEKVRKTSVAERLSREERQSLKRDFNLSDSEIDELEDLASGDINRIRELAKKRQLKKTFDRINEQLDAGKKLEEAEKAKAKQAMDDYLEALEIAQRLRRQEEAYRQVFPATKTSTKIAVPTIGREIAKAPSAPSPVWIEGEEFGKPKTIDVEITAPQRQDVQIIKKWDDKEGKFVTVKVIETTPVTKTKQQEAQEEQEAEQEESKTKVKSATKTDTKADTKTDTKTDTKAKVKPAVETETKTELKPATLTKTDTKIETSTKTDTELKLQTKPETKTELKEEVKSKFKPTIDLKKTLEQPTKKTRKPRPRIRLPGGDTEESEKLYPPGSVAFKAGFGYWVAEPDDKTRDDMDFSIKIPRGAIIAKDAKTAAETIQVIRGTSAPDFNFNLGVVDVSIRRAPSKPSAAAGRKAIKFTRTRNTPAVRRPRKGIQNKKVGKLYIAGEGMVSRKPIGKRRRGK